MTILYDWNKINRAANRQIKDIITILDMITYNRKPRSSKDSRCKFYGRDFSGLSYLLNPKELLEDRGSYTNKEVAQYKALASFRSHAEFVMTGNKSLSLIKNPVPIKLIENNRLLQIDNSIKFLYEEIKEI
jgi:hypothetical protein